MAYYHMSTWSMWSILTTVVICEEKSCIGMVMNDYEAAYALAISSWLATDSNYADCI